MSTTVHLSGTAQPSTTSDRTVGDDTIPESGPESAQDSQLSGLVSRIAGGDRSALAALFDAISGRLVAAMRSRLRDPRQAADVATETFVEVWWMARHHVDPGPDVEAAAWIVDIAARRAEGRMHAAPDVRADPDDAVPTMAGEVHGQTSRLLLAMLLDRPPAALLDPACC
jgi:DNA-directed RNA polymerase specialized sigma24 family protein